MILAHSASPGRRTVGAGSVLSRRHSLFTQSMLIGSRPSVSMNSFTASNARSEAMNRPTGKGVSCNERTHCLIFLMSPLENQSCHGNQSGFAASSAEYVMPQRP